LSVLDLQSSCEEFDHVFSFEESTMHHITGLQNRGGWLCRGIEIMAVSTYTCLCAYFEA